MGGIWLGKFGEGRWKLLGNERIKVIIFLLVDNFFQTVKHELVSLPGAPHYDTKHTSMPQYCHHSSLISGYWINNGDFISDQEFKITQLFLYTRPQYPLHQTVYQQDRSFPLFYFLCRRLVQTNRKFTNCSPYSLTIQYIPTLSSGTQQYY